MGILLNQTIKGNLSYKDGKAVFSGVNSKGTKVRMDIEGGYKDGKKTPLDVEVFKQSFRDLITKSATKAISKEKNKSAQAKIKQELNERLKAFEKGKDISLTINESMGVYIPDKKILVMSAIGNPVTTKKNRIFHNIKPIENDKNNKSYIPIQSTVKAMVMKRKVFDALTPEAKSSIKYDKNSMDSKNWGWKKVSISDLERGNVDLLTVGITASLNKAFAKQSDLLSVLSKDEALVNYSKKELGKEFKANKSMINDSERDKTVVPKTNIYIPENRILEQVGAESTKDLLKKIFIKANVGMSEEEKFFVAVEGDGYEKSIDEDNIDSLEGKLGNKIIKDVYSNILSQFNNSYSDMIGYIGATSKDDDTLSYIKAVDNLHNAKDYKEYVKATKNIYKMTEKDGLINSPISINFPLKTSEFTLKDNPYSQQKQKEEMSKLLKSMAKDITVPLENVFAKYLLTDNKSDYMTNIKSRVEDRVVINQEAKKLEYKADEKGFTLKDRMFLQVGGRIFNQDSFMQGDKKIPTNSFVALRINTKSENDNNNKAFVGIGGVGGRTYEYPKSSTILSSVGMSYMANPMKNLKVNADKTPSLFKNPISGEETPIVIKQAEVKKDKVEPTVVEEKPSKKPNIESPAVVVSQVEEVEKEVKVVSLQENDEDEVPTVSEEENVETIATPETIKEEMAMSLGEGIDFNELAGFLDDDDEIDVKKANDVNSNIDGVSSIAP